MRIEEYPGYNPSMPICIINENEYNGGHVELLQENYPNKIKEIFSVLDENIKILNKNTFISNTLDIKDFIAVYFGMDMNILLDSTEINRIRMLSEVQDMEAYPQDNGIKIVENTLVIKLPN